MTRNSQDMAARLAGRLERQAEAEDELQDKAAPEAKSRMAVPPSAPPGIELDGTGNVIPPGARTLSTTGHHREEALEKAPDPTTREGESHEQ